MKKQKDISLTAGKADHYIKQSQSGIFPIGESIPEGKRHEVCCIKGCGNPAAFMVKDRNFDVYYFCDGHHRLWHSMGIVHEC